MFLGAGKGTRLHPYTIDRPKWLLPIRGRPLLHTLTAMAHLAGATDVVLVRAASGPDPGVPCISVIDNPNNFNMIDSLFKAEEHFRRDFIMSYADIIYEPCVLDSLLGSSADVAVVVDSDWFEYYRFRSSDPIGMAESLKLDGDRITEIGQPLTSGSAVPEGQYIGLARFRGAGVQALVSTYRELCSTHWGKPWRHAARFEAAFMTDMLQELIDRGVDVRAVPIRRGWLEFDTREDYERVLAADESGSLTQYIDLAALPARPTVLSAGGVLWRGAPNGVEVLLVAQGGPSDWRLPKGMQERGEPIEATAAREVAEETGVCCRTGDYIGESIWTYRFGDRDWDEIARFYVMHQVDGFCEPSDPQIVGAEWMIVPAALAALKYGDERNLLAKCAPILSDLGRK